MSFIQSTLKCKDCGHEMNVAFGIVGTTQIASHPTECPKCKSTMLKKISDGWNAKTPMKKPQEEKKTKSSRYSFSTITGGMQKAVKNVFEEKPSPQECKCRCHEIGIHRTNFCFKCVSTHNYKPPQKGYIGTPTTTNTGTYSPPQECWKARGHRMELCEEEKAITKRLGVWHCKNCTNSIEAKTSTEALEKLNEIIGPICLGTMRFQSPQEERWTAEQRKADIEDACGPHREHITTNKDIPSQPAQKEVEGWEKCEYKIEGENMLIKACKDNKCIKLIYWHEDKIKEELKTQRQEVEEMVQKAFDKLVGEDSDTPLFDMLHEILSQLRTMEGGREG